MPRSLDEAADEAFASYQQPQEAAAPSAWDVAADQAFSATKKPVVQPTPEPEKPAYDASKKSFEGNTLQFALPIPGLTDHSFDTGIPLPSGLARGMAQYGSGLADAGLGLRQVLGKANKADADEKKSFDDPLNKGFVGTALNLAGNAAPYIAGGAAAVPLAGTAPAWLAASAPIAYGGAQGFLQPVDTDGFSRATNTGIGLATAGMFPAAKKLFGLGADKVAGPLSQEAADQGYKVTLGDSNKGIVGVIRDKLGQVPAIGQREAVNDFNKAKFSQNVASTWGGTGKVQDFSREGDALATQLSGLYKTNPLTITNQFENKLNAVGKTAASDAERNIVSKVTDEIAGSRVYDSASGRYIADGDKLQSVLQTLKAQSRGDPTLGTNKIRDSLYNTIKDEYMSKLSPEMAERYQKILDKRKAWESVQDYAAKSSKGVAGRSSEALSPDDIAAASAAMYKNAPAPYDKFVPTAQHVLRTADKAPDFSSAVHLPISGPLTAAAAIPSLAINSPAFREVLNNPVVSGALSRAGSQVARPLATQSGLEATESRGATIRRGSEDMKRFLGR